MAKMSARHDSGSMMTWSGDKQGYIVAIQRIFLSTYPRIHFADETALLLAIAHLDLTVDEARAALNVIVVLYPHLLGILQMLHLTLQVLPQGGAVSAYEGHR